MIVDYEKILEALSGIGDGSANTGSVKLKRDYEEVLGMLGCKVDENHIGRIKHLSINMKANNRVIPSCEMYFNINPSDVAHRDNPARVETAISHAKEQYGKEIDSDLIYVDHDRAVVNIDFETNEDAETFYKLIAEEYSKLNNIYELFINNL